MKRKKSIFLFAACFIIIQMVFLFTYKNITRAKDKNSNSTLLTQCLGSCDSGYNGTYNSTYNTPYNGTYNGTYNNPANAPYTNEICTGSNPCPVPDSTYNTNATYNSSYNGGYNSTYNANYDAPYVNNTTYDSTYNGTYGGGGGCTYGVAYYNCSYTCCTGSFPDNISCTTYTYTSATDQTGQAVCTGTVGCTPVCNAPPTPTSSSSCPVVGQTNPYFTCVSNSCVQQNACGTSNSGCTAQGQSCGLNSISGTAFFDTNNNGVQDPGEAGCAGASISYSGSASGSTTTNASGGYVISPLANGTYTVAVSCPGYSANPITVNIANANVIANFALHVVCPIGQSDPYYTCSNHTCVAVAACGVDAGGCSVGTVGNSCGYSISGNIFVDLDNNQIKDVSPAEPNYTGGGIQIKTVDSNGVTFPGIVNKDGTYTISNLHAGVYIVSFTPPPPGGYSFTYPLNGPPPSFTVSVGQ